MSETKKRTNKPETNRSTQKTFTNNKTDLGFKNKTFKFLSPELQNLFTEKKEKYCTETSKINDTQFLEILLNSFH